MAAISCYNPVTYQGFASVLLACDIKIFGENATKLRISVCVVLFLAGMVDAAAAEKPWLEVRSPHFRVLTDASANDARRVAYEFEQE